MFGRHFRMQLKINSAGELTRINENEIIPILGRPKVFLEETFSIASERSEAIANSFWDTRKDAEVYNGAGYSEVLRVVGTPIVKTFEFAISTLPKAAAKKT